MSSDSDVKWADASKQLAYLLASTYSTNGGNGAISDTSHKNLFYNSLKPKVQVLWNDLRGLRLARLSKSNLEKWPKKLKQDKFTSLDGKTFVNGTRRLFDFQLAGTYDEEGNLTMPEFFEDGRLKFDYLPKRRLATIHCAYPNASVIKTVSLIGTYPVKLGVTRVCLMQLDVNNAREPLAGTLTLYEVRAKGKVWNKRTFASIDNIQLIHKDVQHNANQGKKSSKEVAKVSFNEKEPGIEKDSAEKSSIYFLQFRDRTESGKIAYFQLVVELPGNLRSYNRLVEEYPYYTADEDLPNFRASFSSINNDYGWLGPTSGLAYFWEASPIEFNDLVSHLNPDERPIVDEMREAMLRRNSKMFNETSAKLNEQFLSFNHPALGPVKPFESEEVGEYRGCLFFPGSGEIPGTLFSMTLTEQGTVTFNRVAEKMTYTGYFRRDGESLLIKLAFELRNEAFLLRVPLNSRTQPVVGVFVGRIREKESGESKFYCETLLLEKVTETADKQSEVEKLYQNRELLAQFLNRSDGFLPARTLLSKKLSETSAKHTSAVKPLRENGFPRHFKYFAYHVPTNYNDSKDNVSHRIEKCDLQFEADYSKATLCMSGGKVYDGIVYFDEKMIFILFEEEESSPDSFFTIHLDVRKVKGSKEKVDAVFGISTHCNIRIESKMIALVRVDDDNNRDVNSYQLDLINPELLEVGDPEQRQEAEQKRQELLNALMEDDRRYKGAISYSAGRINRHIHVSSGSGRREHFRPRDIKSREPYFFAALCLTQCIGKRDPIETIADTQNLIWKAKTYFFEAYLHQFASEHFEGGVLEEKSEGIKDRETKSRLMEISREKNYLSKVYNKINNQDIKEYIKVLWPFVEKTQKQQKKKKA